jgi:hypothetical protein
VGRLWIGTSIKYCINLDMFAAFSTVD